MKKLLFGMAFFMGTMMFASLRVQALEDEWKDTVVRGEGGIITVTVCDRKTTIRDTLKGDSCTKPSTVPCTFTNDGNLPV